MTEVGSDAYLDRYANDLEGALGLVVSDLKTSGLSDEEIDELVWRLADWYADSTGVAPAGVLALTVAEQAQEWVIENLTAHNWPPCPMHPNHPLWLASEYPFTSWTCQTTGEHVARVGDIRSVMP